MGDMLREVASRRMCEEQFLRQHAARRENADLFLLLLPSLQCTWNVIKNLAAQFASLIALFPDPALERFQGCRFAIAVHQPLNVFNNGLQFFFWRVMTQQGRVQTLARIYSVFFAKPGNVSEHFLG